jgi:hypothetical protein
MTDELLPIVTAEIGNGFACDRIDEETARRVLDHVETWLLNQPSSVKYGTYRCELSDQPPASHD